MEPSTSAQVEPPAEGLTCPECGDEIIPKGKMAPNMALGLHRKAAHGVAGRPRNAKRNKAKAAEPVMPTAAPSTPDRPTMTLLHGAGQDAKRGRSAPDADGLARALGRIYSYVGYFAWSTIVDRDPTVPPAMREQLVTELAPTGAEGIATVHPLARILAATTINKRYGAGLIDNLDVADAVAAIGDQVQRARTYASMRRQAIGGQFPPGPAGPPASAGPGAFVNADAPDGVPPNPMMGGYAGPERGVVVDADMVAAMRRGAAAGPAFPDVGPGPEAAE